MLPAALAKGLEFDCVIVAECNAEVFPDDPFLCRVLYVLLTRPLHRLALVHTGVMTPLVPGGGKPGIAATDGIRLLK